MCKTKVGPNKNPATASTMPAGVTTAKVVGGLDVSVRIKADS